MRFLQPAHILGRWKGEICHRQRYRVDEAAALIRDRIKELEGERAQLERALASLTSGREGRRGPAGPAGPPPRPPRPADGVAAAAEPALTRPWKLIAEKPGSSASDLASEMKIKPNYLYRVLETSRRTARSARTGAPTTRPRRPGGGPQVKRS